MARRFRSGRFRGRGKARRTTWETIPGLVDLSIAPGTELASGRLDFLENGYSVRRLLGKIRVTFDWTGDSVAAGDITTYAIGLAKVPTDNAVGAGLPDPQDEPEYPWLLWFTGTLVAMSAEPTSGEVWSSPPVSLAYHEHEFDSRVMRNLRPSESLTWILQSTAIAGAAPLGLFMEPTRVLLAMP